MTDALSQVTGFSTDAIGRVTKQTQADLSQILFSFDGNSNLISLTPPGKPRHDLGYTGVDLQSDDLPPDPVTGALDPAAYVTRFIYNGDRQLTQVKRPDGRIVNEAYDATSGKLTSVAEGANPVLSLSYSSATGQLTGLTRSEGQALSLSYDGAHP